MEPTIWFECPLKYFALFVVLFPLVVAFELLLLHDNTWNSISFCTFFVYCTGRQIHLSVFIVSSITFGFCIISYEEFKSCLLTPFKGFMLVLKPYIVFFAFIFEKSYWIRILSSILCTLGTMYVYIYIRTYIGVQLNL